MAKIIITGGTGLVGSTLSQYLKSKGHSIVIFSRNKEGIQNGIEYHIWNTEKGIIDNESISTSDAIINLAGAGVADKKWTKKRKLEIQQSRVNSGKLIVQALKEIPNNIKTIIQASAIGWYGPDPATLKNKKGFVETDIAANDYLGKTCQMWETSIHPTEILGKRIVTLRIGIVLSKRGGALKEFTKPLNFGIAPIMGTGKQIISWITIDDLCRMIEYALMHEQIKGVYNAVSPSPVSNKEMILSIARSNKKFFIPLKVPAWILKLLLGEMSIEILKSATVDSSKIINEGFNFLYANINDAVKKCS